MPVIKTQLQTGMEPEEGGKYKITGAEELKTAVMNYEGIRITMTSTNKEDKQTYATMLWNREIASSSSKIGAFLQAFSDYIERKQLTDGNNKPLEPNNTDNWIGHTISITMWRQKKREIEILA